jgi:hypothetical protein
MDIRADQTFARYHKELYSIRLAITLNSAITTEKNVINPVANISGLENAAGLLKTKVW